MADLPRVVTVIVFWGRYFSYSGYGHCAPIVFMSDTNYNKSMKRVGRPPTGHQPRLSVRMEPSMLKLAAQAAKAKGQTIGTWLTKAINEKVQREGDNG